MQPHYPFIGETKLESGNIRNLRAKASNRVGESEKSVWDRLGDSEINKEKVWDAYADNLRYVLNDVTSLVKALSGRVVLSTDHGNAFGERHPILGVRVFGHPTSLRLDCLVDVPWYVVDIEDQKHTEFEQLGRGQSNDGVGTPELNSDEEELIEDRLSDLGYT
jgi:hypothetical protein